VTATTSGGPLVVEIVGPPGAGKTTLVAAVAAAPGAGVVAVDRRQLGFGAILGSLRSAPSVARAVAAAPGRVRPTAWELRKMLRLGGASALVRRQAGFGARVIAFDQGPVYTLSRLSGLAERAGLVSAFRRWWKARLAEWAATLDLVVTLDAPDDVLVDRIRARDKRHRAKDAGTVGARGIVEDERSSYARVLSDLRQRGVDVLAIDAQRTRVPEAVASVMRAIDASAAARARPVRLRSGHDRRGLLVAVVGADGSGKSTLTRRLPSSVRWRGDVHRLYLGSGDGPASLVRRPMKAVRDRIVPAKAAASRVSGKAPSSAARAGRRRPAWLRAARAGWALALAGEKQRSLRSAWLARDAGDLVVCDRYPQAEVPGSNDGPLLSHWRSSRGRALRALAAWEGRPYELAARTPPDLVLRLNVDEATARARRPGLPDGYLRDRIALVGALRFGGAAIIELDATRDADEVLAAAAEAIEDVGGAPREGAAAPRGG
jgi:thymidylate kinase